MNAQSQARKIKSVAGLIAESGRLTKTEMNVGLIVIEFVFRKFDLYGKGYTFSVHLEEIGEAVKEVCGVEYSEKEIENALVALDHYNVCPLTDWVPVTSKLLPAVMLNTFDY